jgi:hypothetical protein
MIINTTSQMYIPLLSIYLNRFTGDSTRITFFGGAREVGRNCIGVQGEGHPLLLDAGIKLGKKEEYPLLDDNDVNRFRRVVITHTHLDHAGYLPHLFARGSKAEIFATKPTRDLTQLLLADYLRINSHAGFTNKDIVKVMKMCKMVEYGEVVDGGLNFSLHKAGHILGSSMVLVKNGKRLLYTSDTNNRETKLLDPAERGLEADVMIIESTYGSKNDVHPPLKKASKMLCDSIMETVKRGGTVLIPSFAVGRGQEILLILESYMRSGVLEKVPIFVDGMIIKANRIYRQNVIYAKDEIQKRILMSDDDPFKSKFFKVPRTKDRGDVLERSAVILTTSGMLSGGPVLHYLKKLAGDENSKLLLVGYQAEGTLGRRLLDGEEKVKINDDEIEVKMKVEQIQFSAHADHASLVDFARSIKGLRKVFIIHGEDNKPVELGKALEELEYEVVIPRNGESFEI